MPTGSFLGAGTKVTVGEGGTPLAQLCLFKNIFVIIKTVRLAL